MRGELLAKLGGDLLVEGEEHCLVIGGDQLGGFDDGGGLAAACDCLNDECALAGDVGLNPVENRFLVSGEFHLFRSELAL